MAVPLPGQRNEGVGDAGQGAAGPAEAASEPAWAGGVRPGPLQRGSEALSPCREVKDTCTSSSAEGDHRQGC